MDIQHILQDYGLKENHAKIYLACLELGSSPILKIAQKSGYARSTCEAILERLQDEGFISSFRKKRVKYFSAEDPHKIIRLAKEKAVLLERSLPQFMSLYGNASILPSVRMYKGKQGMKIILEEILEEAKELLSFSSADDLLEILGNEWPDFVRRRIQKKIPAKVILRRSTTALERQRLGPQQLREVRLISSDYEMHGLIFIWSNKITMFSFEKDLVALVIESETLAKVQSNMFYVIWNQLQKNI